MAADTNEGVKRRKKKRRPKAAAAEAFEQKQTFTSPPDQPDQETDAAGNQPSANRTGQVEELMPSASSQQAAHSSQQAETSQQTESSKANVGPEEKKALRELDKVLKDAKEKMMSDAELAEFAANEINARHAEKWQEDLHKGMKERKVVFQGRRVRR